MALTDYINTQPSEANITDTGISDPFGLKEDAKKAFKNQKGVSYDDASQETINDLRDSQFNPILEETGAVNEDGSINDDVMDDVTGEVTVEPEVPTIADVGNLPGWIPSIGGGNNSNPSDGSDFMPFKGLIEGVKNTGGRLADVGQVFNSGSSNDSGFSLGFLEKIMVLAVILTLGPALIKALSGEN